MRVALMVPCYIDMFYPQVGKSTLELLERLEKADPGQWNCGFLTSAEMERFSRLVNLSQWRRRRPVLAVVDYAAGSAEKLRVWLEQLAAELGKDGAAAEVLVADLTQSDDVARVEQKLEGDGAITFQPPSSNGRSIPSHISLVAPLRPA